MIAYCTTLFKHVILYAGNPLLHFERVQYGTHMYTHIFQLN